jgi:hypothetical protein
MRDPSASGEGFNIKREGFVTRMGGDEAESTAEIRAAPDNAYSPAKGHAPILSQSARLTLKGWTGALQQSLHNLRSGIELRLCQPQCSA